MQYQAVVRKFGSAQDVVELERAALPLLRRDQVRVRLLARAINPSDIITISGAYSGRTTLPFIPGFEAFGVVEKCGEEVHGLSPGTRVLPVRSAGGWQEFKDTDPDWCLRVPDDLTDFEAATSYVNPMTAWLMLHAKIGLRPGMRIAINAAASSIGAILIGLANAAGVEPVAIVRSEGSLERLRGRVEAVIVDREEAKAICSPGSPVGMGSTRCSIASEARAPQSSPMRCGRADASCITACFRAKAFRIHSGRPIPIFPFPIFTSGNGFIPKLWTTCSTPIPRSRRRSFRRSSRLRYGRYSPWKRSGKPCSPRFPCERAARCSWPDRASP